jgi:hypothetical protein
MHMHHLCSESFRAAGFASTTLRDSRRRVSVPQQRFRDSAAGASWTSIIGRRLTMAHQTRCIDCNAAGIETTRPALKPGPRCEQHWRETKRKRSDAAHGKHLEKAFSITSEIYAYVKNKQGGRVLRMRTRQRQNETPCRRPRSPM